MNNAKLNVYKKRLQEVCERFLGTEEFMNDKVEEIFCNEKLSVERGDLFCLFVYATTFKAKLVMFVKNLIKRVC